VTTATAAHPTCVASILTASYTNTAWSPRRPSWWDDEAVYGTASSPGTGSYDW
jgi:hypothetical protein